MLRPAASCPASRPPFGAPRGRAGRDLQPAAGPMAVGLRAKFEFVTQEEEQARGLAGEICSVDCSHPTALTLTHHKGNNNPPDVEPADTSTGLVLHALQSGDGQGSRKWVEQPYVSTNHFDIDALTAVWAYLNRELATEYSTVLELVAHLGDFREAPLGSALAPGTSAALCDSDVNDALKVCCWLNTLERERFSKPWEVKDSDEKFDWFLPRFQDVLANPEGARHLWEKEYNEVLEGFAHLEGRVDTHNDLGFAIARPERQLHYYSLFCRTIGSDVLLTVYPDNKYELEAKYTQYVEFHSRPVWPRLDFGPLAKALNRLERQRRECDEDSFEWVADRLVYGGPLLRLDRKGTKLTTVQKYGHPTDRPIYSSALLPAEVERAVTSFLQHGLQGLQPRHGGWSWEELQRISRARDWDAWEAGLVRELEAHQTCV